MSEEYLTLFSDGVPYLGISYDVSERVRKEYINLRISLKDDLDAGISRYMDKIGNLIIDILREYCETDSEESKSLIYKHLGEFLNAENGDYGIISGKSGRIISPVISMYHLMYFSAGFPKDEYIFRMTKYAKAFKDQTEEMFKKGCAPVNDIGKEINRLKDLPSYINEVTVPLEDIEFDDDKMILKCIDLEAIKIADEIFEGISTEDDDDKDMISEDDHDEIFRTLKEIYDGLEDLSRKDD